MEVPVVQGRAVVALVSTLWAVGATGCGEDAGTSGADRGVGLPTTDGGSDDGGGGAIDHGGPDARFTDGGGVDAAGRDLGPADAVPADASDGGAPDAGPPPDTGRPLAPFGAACVEDVECAAGRCLALGPLGRGRCGDPCPTGECPPGGRCVADPAGAPVCVPAEVCADFDGDTYGDGDACAGPDCDDADPNRHPGAAERCDGRDDDCDGALDESAEDADVPCQTGRPGVCAPGWALCALGALSCVATAEPSEETCNGLDDDCDGRVDEALFEPCGSEVGACEPGRRSCVDGAFGACVGAVGPQLEVCNGLDDDCNGLLDDQPFIGQGRFSDPAWPQAQGRPLVAVDPQGRALVAYSSWGVNGARHVQALLLDPGAGQTLASRELSRESHGVGRPVWVGDEWWVTAVERAGSSEARLSIWRLDANGRVLEPLPSVGPEVDAYNLAARSGEVVAYWLDDRNILRLAHWRRDPAGRWQRTDHLIEEAGLALDQAVLLAADEAGWLLGREVRVGQFDSRFEVARWTLEAGLSPWVQAGGIRNRRANLVRWGDGHALISRLWTPQVGTTLDALPIDAALNIGDPVTLVNDPGVVSSEYYDVYAHGAQGWTLIEPLPPGRDGRAALSRFDADATPIILRGVVLDGPDPVEPFNLDLAGDGPSLVQVWRRGAQVQVAYGPVGGCPPAAP